MGIEGEVERILNANKQLSRLFVREYLLPFRWQPDEPESITDFARLISYVQKVLEVKLTEAEPWPVLLFRIHLATSGVMSSIMNLFRQAVRIQQRQGLVGEPLSLDVLAEAYGQRLQSHVGVDNPFRSWSKTSTLPLNGNSPLPEQT